MTRAEFLGKIFDVDPMDILLPLQNPTPMCRYTNCECNSCEGCKSDPSYWNTEITDNDELLSYGSYLRVYMREFELHDGDKEDLL